MFIDWQLLNKCIRHRAKYVIVNTEYFRFIQSLAGSGFYGSFQERE